MKRISLYTDGACSGNPGPGGWAAILHWGEYEKELCGGETETTNNRMELTAALEGLKALRQPCEVELYSDSQYLINGFEKGWVYQWEKKDWMRTKTEPVKNPELWKELLAMSRIHRISFHWVKGHADDELNLRCDRLAVAQTKLRSGEFPGPRDPEKMPAMT